MTIARISEIERVPLAVDYRRMFRGDVYVSVGSQTVGPTRIEFVLELSPFGTHEVTVRFLDTAHFPLVPVIRLLKEHIGELDRAGGLNPI